MNQASEMKLVYAELRDEHKELMALLDQLSDQTRAKDLVSLLEELHGLLIRHFAHEQFPGGLYESMGISGSEYREELKILVEDHVHILSEVRGLLERARLGRNGNNDKTLNEIVSKIHEHEQREHALAEKVIERTSASEATGA